VPDSDGQQDRSLIRMRLSFSMKLTRCKNQIKCFLKILWNTDTRRHGPKILVKAIYQLARTIKIFAPFCQRCFGRSSEELLFLRHERKIAIKDQIVIISNIVWLQQLLSRINAFFRAKKRCTGEGSIRRAI
jgi:hypothetical protein